MEEACHIAVDVIHSYMIDVLEALGTPPGDPRICADALIASDLRGIESHTAIVGSIWDRLTRQYAATYVYCTPSVMEGFSMCAQEAAATGVPILASHVVPFVVEFLLGEDVKELAYDRGLGRTVRQGSGAIVVQAGDVRGLANALEHVPVNDRLRPTMGESAYRATIPYFTWNRMTSAFLADIGVALDKGPRSPTVAHCIPEPPG